MKTLLWNVCPVCLCLATLLSGELMMNHGGQLASVPERIVTKAGANLHKHSARLQGLGRRIYFARPEMRRFSQAARLATDVATPAGRASSPPLRKGG